MQAKFSGPYFVDCQLSDTNYVIKTPDQRRKSQVCHVNMLKCYSSHTDTLSPIVPVAMVAVPHPSSEEDELSDRRGSAPCESQRFCPSWMSICHICLSQPIGMLSGSFIVTLIFLVITPLRHTSFVTILKLVEHRPIKQHVYRVNPTKQAIMQQEVEYLLQNGIAVPSSSAWSFPSLLEPKLDQSPRFCNDYWKLSQNWSPFRCLGLRTALIKWVLQNLLPNLTCLRVTGRSPSLLAPQKCLPL